MISIKHIQKKSFYQLRPHFPYTHSSLKRFWNFLGNVLAQSCSALVCAYQGLDLWAKLQTYKAIKPQTSSKAHKNPIFNQSQRCFWLLKLLCQVHLVTKWLPNLNRIEKKSKPPFHLDGNVSANLTLGNKQRFVSRDGSCLCKRNTESVSIKK